jgi:hypothetical protein
MDLLDFYQQADRGLRSRDRGVPRRLRPPDRGPHAPGQAAHDQAEPYGPPFDVRTHLYRLTGVDLTRIDGIDAPTALKVVAETGLDMSRWPSDKHFASWLTLAPGTKVSGGKTLSGRTKPSASRAAAALRLAARSLHHSKSALGAFFRRL